MELKLARSPEPSTDGSDSSFSSGVCQLEAVENNLLKAHFLHLYNKDKRSTYLRVTEAIECDDSHVVPNLWWRTLSFRGQLPVLWLILLLPFKLVMFQSTHIYTQ